MLKIKEWMGIGDPHVAPLPLVLGSMDPSTSAPSRRLCFKFMEAALLQAVGSFSMALGARPFSPMKTTSTRF
jgi:hypothetical protein